MCSGPGAFCPGLVCIAPLGLGGRRGFHVHVWEGNGLRVGGFAVRLNSFAPRGLTMERVRLGLARGAAILVVRLSEGACIHDAQAHPGGVEWPATLALSIRKHVCYAHRASPLGLIGEFRIRSEKGNRLESIQETTSRVRRLAPESNPSGFNRMGKTLILGYRRRRAQTPLPSR